MKKELGGNFEKEIFQFICDNRDKVIQFARPDADKVSNSVRQAIAKSKKTKDKVIHHKREGEADFYLRNGERIIFYADRLREIDGKLTTAEPLSDLWNDVVPNDLHREGGVDLKKGKKPEKLLHRLIELNSDEGDIVLDYFVGSGTSACVAHKINRRWIGIDQAYYFDEKSLIRAKRVLGGDSSGISSVVKWKGSGFFKYFALETYQDVLLTSLYSGDEGDLFRNTKKDPYTQYVFLRDEKQSQVLELDYENDEVNVDLTRLYPDIDLAETLSCVTGKWIKRITKDEVEFADGSKESLVKPDWRLLKPLIFWGPAE